MTTEPAACRLQRVDGRKLLPLGLGVTSLLVLAGIASHGRPLAGGSRGTGPTASFFDYVFTTLVLMAVAIAVAFVYLLLTTDTSRPKQLGHRWHVVSALLTMAVSAAVAVLILHTGFAQRFRELAQRVKPGQPAQKRQVQPPGKNVRPARVRWDEVGIVIALLAGTTVLLVASLSTTSATSRTCAARSSPRTREWSVRSRARASHETRRRRRSSISSAPCAASTRAPQRCSASPTCSNGQSSASMSPSRR